MALFLITSVCKDGVDQSSFRVVEAESARAVAGAILEDPYAWEPLLQNTELWWDLTRYEYKYGEPLDWSSDDLLPKIDTTWMDGDSRNQVRIHEIRDIACIRPQRSKEACILS
jgi:hypothetical protein